MTYINKFRFHESLALKSMFDLMLAAFPLPLPRRAVSLWHVLKLRFQAAQ
jgi:hypothetical protein